MTRSYFQFPCSRYLGGAKFMSCGQSDFQDCHRVVVEMSPRPNADVEEESRIARLGVEVATASATHSHSHQKCKSAGRAETSSRRCT